MDWTLLSGPLTGALIGYLTNYLAVKMLFRPRKAIYIFKKRLPFTPGVITRGKDRLAKAVSRLVSETLITEEDIRGYLLSAEMENSVAEKAEEILSEKLRDEIIEKSAIKSSEYEKKTRRSVSFCKQGHIRSCSGNACKRKNNRDGVP